MSSATIDHPLVAVAVFFVLSLGGAYVLFRTLKATAVMKTVRGQAGGALAGFLMIFAALGGTYLKLLPTTEELRALSAQNAALEARLEEIREQTETAVWSLVGEVRLTGGEDASGVEVVVMPPNPRKLLEGHGDFRFDNLKMVQGIWPELHVSADGYYPETLILSDDDLEVFEDRHLVRLREPVMLYDEPGTFGVADGDLGAGPGPEPTDQASGS